MDIHQAFRLLKLDAGASLEVVKRRYHELAARWHPDRHPPNSPAKDQATEKMKELNAAYTFIRRFSETHQILFCKQCGATNSRLKDANVEYAACGHCGNQLQMATPRKQRTPCGNARCSGTIGSNGRCNYCGKTVAEGRESSLAGEEGHRFTRSRSFARSAARIAKTLFLVVIACGSVAAAYLFYHHHEKVGEPVLPVRHPSVAAPPAGASPQHVEPRRAFFQAPAPVVVPEHSFYLDLFRRRPLPKEEVMRLQRMLKTIGYAIEKVDGAAGKNTAASLMQYSADFGYLPTDRFPHCFFEHADLHHRIALEHPGWLDIFLSGDLGSWVNAQPERVRKEIYAAACDKPSADGRFGFGAADQLFHGGQGVERREVRGTPRLTGPESDLAGEPVMAVDHIIPRALPLPEALQRVKESRKMRVEDCFGSVPTRPKIQMDEAHIFRNPQNVAACKAAAGARVDIHAMAAQTHVPRELTDVDAHSARVLGAETAYGAGVYADHGDGVSCRTQGGFLNSLHAPDSSIRQR